MIEEKLVTPPIRAALMEENGGDAKTPSRDWWLYWNALTLRANQNAAEIDQLESRAAELDSAVDAIDEEMADMLRSGTHAARLAAVPDPLGAIWVETDRNHIAYQAQLVAGAAVWVYVTGAMRGTILAVDQRPTDLGANDTGLVFLSSDSRSVRWTGSSWGPLDYLETNAVIGALGLTHTNVVTKVGAAGQIVEGGITDDSAANSNTVRITAAGDVGFRTTPAGSLHIAKSVAGGLGPNIILDNPAAGINDAVALQYVDAGTLRGQLQMQVVRSPFTADFAFYTGTFTEVLRILNSGGVAIQSLPASNPGPGSRQLWYDPADGNRVKFAP